MFNMSEDLFDPFNNDFDDNLSPENDFFGNLGRNMFKGLSNLGSNDGRANVVDTKKNYKVSVELPGFKKDSIHLDYRKNTLSIEAKHNVSKQSKNEKGKVIRKEYGNSNVARQFYLPNVDFNKISAGYDGGILKIVLPKKDEPKDNSHRITIK